MKIVTARHENRDEIDVFSAVAVMKIVTSLSTIPLGGQGAKPTGHKSEAER